MNLTEFQPITSGNFCVLGDAASGLNPLVIAANGGGSVEFLNGDPSANGIAVTKPVPIGFGIFPVLGGQYSIVGCIFVSGSGALTDRNFQHISWQPTRLTFQARHADLNTAWKLYVAITESSSGRLGIIDPDIENSSDTKDDPPGPRPPQN